MSGSGLEAALDQAARVLAGADCLVIFTGAGMGVDSGLGTFRGRNAGVWPPLLAMDADFSELSNPAVFERDPRLAWNFWRFRTAAYMRDSSPHEGYRILAEWARSMPHGYFSVTSNVDGHWHQVVASDHVLEVHGAVTHMQGMDDDGVIWEADADEIIALDAPAWDVQPGEAVWYTDRDSLCGHSIASEEKRGVMAEDGSSVLDANGVPVGVATLRKASGGPDLLRVLSECPLPVCAGTNEPARPNVLMFGDMEFNCDRNMAQENAFDDFIDGLPVDARVAVVEVGAGLTISTIRDMAEAFVARFDQATLIRLNLDDSDADGDLQNHVISIPMGALAGLTALRDRKPSVGSAGSQPSSPRA